ncbi:MAG TPA: nucleotide sugar dehydrogenase [Acidimicrobiales bacterium]|nr:nucleotide sugar dehydrogenase [Acidimicrobiales bacterium]
MADSSGFEAKLAAKDLTIGVVGLGYVGLPLAITYAEAGFTCIGIDVDAERAAALNAGASHIEDIASERVAAVVEAQRFNATADPQRLREADVVFVCVPTPFDRAKTPDLSFVRAAITDVAAVLRPGMLIVLQSTTFPGTTTEVCQPILESSGLKAGVDFHLAFSPERVDPGNATWNVRNTPKVVGGVTAVSAERARAILEAVMERRGLVTVLSSPAAAEMTKLLENTYRAVNIAMVGELAMLSHEMGLDIWEVIDGAATKPFGFQAFYPGVGPGGHCIPVDPYYLSWRAREFDFQTKFIELAADTNLRMAHYVTKRVQDFLNRSGHPLRGARVLALGASFKPGVSDVRNSRAVRVMELLEEAGGMVDYVDPHVPTVNLAGRSRKAVDLSEGLSAADIVVVLVGHQNWPMDKIIHSGTPVFDAVNATAGFAAAHVERL